MQEHAMHSLFTSALVVFLGLFSMLGLPAFAAGTETSTPEVAGYDEAKAAVDSGNFAAALPMLEALVKTDAQNADAWNLIGFTYRKLGQMEDSDSAYLKVLAINPDHLGALEYQGELFLTLGRIDEAKANLARLQSLCGNCEQYEDLEKALKDAGV
jgi:tetratricopeptide (TPR) repeat protein